MTPDLDLPDLLTRLGWSPDLAPSGADLETTPPLRVVAVHRSGMVALGEMGEVSLPPSLPATVGDWILLHRELPQQSVVLDRKSLIRRRAAGTGRALQMIAANIDTAFLTASCNLDFNVARLERYIALTLEAGVAPVVVLTKADLADPAPYIESARKIRADLPVIALNAHARDAALALAPWCGRGRTVAFLGSSGVGKSTLVNALCAEASVETAAIREIDAKGRHTTTHREIHFSDLGACVLDTPGMREIQLADTGAGLIALFADLEELATQCKFRDCRHEREPDCAVQAAVARGEIALERLARWRKLAEEDRANTEAMAVKKTPRRAETKSPRPRPKAPQVSDYDDD